MSEEEEEEVFIYGPSPLWPLSRKFRILLAVFLAVTCLAGDVDWYFIISLFASLLNNFKANNITLACHWGFNAVSIRRSI